MAEEEEGCGGGCSKRQRTGISIKKEGQKKKVAAATGEAAGQQDEHCMQAAGSSQEHLCSRCSMGLSLDAASSLPLSQADLDLQQQVFGGMEPGDLQGYRSRVAGLSRDQLFGLIKLTTVWQALAVQEAKCRQ